MRSCDAATREAATCEARAKLQCCGAVVRDNGGRQRIKQRWRVALELATTAGSSDVRRRYAALQQWQAAAAEIFVFFILFLFIFYFLFLFFIFYSTASREKKRARKREKRQASKLVYRLCLLATSFLSTSTPFNGSSNTSTLQQHQHQQHQQH
jgi:hypothetical protein